MHHRALLMQQGLEWGVAEAVMPVSQVQLLPRQHIPTITAAALQSCALQFHWSACAVRILL